MRSIVVAISMVGFCLANGVLAQRASLELEDKTVRVEQLQRNMDLIKKLVRGGVHLANEKTAMERADWCANLAEDLSINIRKAVRAEDWNRATAMSNHLEAFIKEGVSMNLLAVRHQEPAGSVPEKELRQVVKKVTKLTRPLEELLRQLPPKSHPDLYLTLKSVAQSQKAIVAIVPPE